MSGPTVALTHGSAEAQAYPASELATLQARVTELEGVLDGQRAELRHAQTNADSFYKKWSAAADREAELTEILRELDSLREGSDDDVLAAVSGGPIRAFVVRYRAALTERSSR